MGIDPVSHGEEEAQERVRVVPRNPHRVVFRLPPDRLRLGEGDGTIGQFADERRDEAMFYLAQPGERGLEERPVIVPDLPHGRPEAGRREIGLPVQGVAEADEGRPRRRGGRPKMGSLTPAGVRARRATYPSMDRLKASAKSGCQRESAGRFSMMSPAAQAIRFSSCARVVSLSGQRM